MPTIHGKPASPGIGLGVAWCLRPQVYDIKPTRKGSLLEEQERLTAAIQLSRADLQELVRRAEIKSGADKAQIFQSHLMFLEDPEWRERIASLLDDGLSSAEIAVQRATQEFADMFASIEDEYLRERAGDLHDVGRRVLRKLMGKPETDLSLVNEEVILIAHDLTPSDTVLLDPKWVKGIVTEIGGKTSHSAIIARSLEIPAVLGVKDALSIIQDKSKVGIDGEEGEIWINPAVTTWSALESKQSQYRQLQQELLSLKDQPSVTQDGHKIVLAANAGALSDLDVLAKYGAEGIGLFRSEFIFMNRETAPSEEEQFQVYKQILESASDLCVIRTLDVGGDKKIPYMGIPAEENPFLGNRALRYCLQHPDFFKKQLRALLRASALGELGIMFPMVTSVEEVRAANALLADAHRELSSEGVSVGKYQVGIMIEIPSSGLLADVLAEEVDFFSIGTNDLTQYVLAVDRMNEQISHLYESYHPALLRLINHVANAARQSKRRPWVGMCGEMASDENLLPLWVAMGLDELSMAPSAILRIKKNLRQLSRNEVLLSRVLKAGTSDEIKQILKEDR